MALIQSPLVILAVLILAVVAAEFLGRMRWARAMGPALMVILLGALLANLRIIPPAGAGGPVYDPIFSTVTPAAIFLILLEANLRALRRAGAAMLFAFGLGAVGTVAGVLAAVWLTPARDMLGQDLPALAGMFTGTYIGGSANFNAVALHFGLLKEGGIYTAAVVVDNVMTGLWILVTVAMPVVLYRSGLFGRRAAAPVDPEAIPAPADAPPPLAGVLALAIPVAAAICGVAASNWIAARLAAVGLPVPSVIVLTTLALAAAQIRAVARMTMVRPIGLFAVYLFLAVVGASADVGALVAAGPVGLMMLAFVAIVMAVHGVVIVGTGRLFRIEPEVLAIASNANIGGGTSALSLAETFGREDLVLPAVLAGTVGTAIGTYIGFAVAAVV